MEYLWNISCDSIQTASDMLYECPCGKAYRSYPALYTHIKNKHNGKAPGNIKKPNLPLKKRGRPPIHRQNTVIQENSKNLDQSHGCLFGSTEQQCATNHRSSSEEFLASLANIIKTLPKQTINKSRLNQITSILQMNVYLVTKQSSEVSLFIGPVLSQFLRQMSSRVQWHHFSQTYTLLMLLVQFIIDDLRDNKIITDGPVDLLCDYINNFLKDGLASMAAYYSVSSLSIFRQDIVLDIFHGFFGWLMAKKYTNYRISLNSEFNLQLD